MGRDLARRLAFPVILGGTLASAMALLAAGWSPAAAVGVVQAAGALAIALVERLLPFRPEWNRSHGDVTTDVAHVLASGMLTTRVAETVSVAAASQVAVALAGVAGGALWPTAWPAWAQLALALLVAEFFQYWLHRLQHERDALWRFHAVHHSAPRLYWLNAARFHPVDLFLLYLVGYCPLIALGCPREVIALFAVFDAVFGMLQHANVDVRLGALNRLFSMAEPHRWHHSLALDEANTNYGSNLIVWDHVFGTFFLPAAKPPPARIGIGDLPRFPTGWASQILAPFRWAHIRGQAPPSASRTAATTT